MEGERRRGIRAARRAHDNEAPSTYADTLCDEQMRELESTYTCRANTRQHTDGQRVGATLCELKREANCAREWRCCGLLEVKDDNQITHEWGTIKAYMTGRDNPGDKDGRSTRWLTVAKLMRRCDRVNRWNLDERAFSKPNRNSRTPELNAADEACTPVG